jgi:hypothetical protein
MPSNITVIFADGSRETFTQVEDSLADENPPVKFLALVRSKYPDKKVAKLEKGKLAVNLKGIKDVGKIWALAIYII